MNSLVAHSIQCSVNGGHKSTVMGGSQPLLRSATERAHEIHKKAQEERNERKKKTKLR